MSLEAAISLLKRAVELDEGKRYTEALVCYQEGIGLLLASLKETSDETKKAHLKEQCKSYFDRAEKLKICVKEQQEAGKYHEQIQIKNGSVGHSYARTIGPYLSKEVTEVTVEDPYIRNVHQIYNFLRFCELLVAKAKSVRIVKLVTGLDDDAANQRQQLERLQELSKDLKKHHIDLQITYSSTLHDREIRFNNGWVIKIGRGLDYFKRPSSKFSIGFCDFDFRECHETTVDIFLKKT